MHDQTAVQFVEAARDVLKEFGYFMEHLWHTDDVHFLCEQRGWPKLNHEEAKGVFGIFSQMYDGELGMTWAKLEQATQVYLAEHGRMARAAERCPGITTIEELLIDQEAV